MVQQAVTVELASACRCGISAHRAAETSGLACEGRAPWPGRRPQWRAGLRSLVTGPPPPPLECHPHLSLIFWVNAASASRSAPACSRSRLRASASGPTCRASEPFGNTGTAAARSQRAARNVAAVEADLINNGRVLSRPHQVPSGARAGTQPRPAPRPTVPSGRATGPERHALGPRGSA